jgi:hypothetical protein
MAHLQHRAQSRNPALAIKSREETVQTRDVHAEVARELEQDGAEREDPHINDKLFECAWRKAREADQARRFSNQ